MAASLGLFAGASAASVCLSGSVWLQLGGLRTGRRQPAWHPTKVRDITALFHGRLDNCADLASELGIASGDPALVYACAVERWGRDAERRCIGSYCAIVECGDGTLRLSRSPWTAPPLVYANDGLKAVVASVPRVLFAAGVPQTLNLTRFADTLYFNPVFDDGGWFEATWRVPHGTIVTLAEGSRHVDRWYDPMAVPEIRLATDQAYVDAAQSLVDEAATKAMVGVRQPAIALSGGLDSPQAAAAILRILPKDAVLRSFTAVPLDQWDGRVSPGMFGDERPWVEHLALTEPRLRPTFLDRPEGGFDERLPEMFAAMGVAPRHTANLSFYHAVFAAARQAGCDVMFDAESGNDTLSHDGRWCYVEFLRTGRWRQLYWVMKARPDPRPVWRRIASLSVLRSLPTPLRRGIRRIVGRAGLKHHAQLHLLTPTAIARFKLSERAQAGGTLDHEYLATREETIRHAYRTIDFEAAEVWQAIEEIHGITRRDVFAYRPLIEFCMGLPTEQFVRDGVDRFLARRMARGVMPEAQRINPLYGQHSADWHTRLTRQRDQLLAEAKRLRDDPDLNAILDIDRMIDLLQDWPDETPLDRETALPRQVGLTRAFIAARYMRFVSGRNAP